MGSESLYPLFQSPLSIRGPLRGRVISTISIITGVNAIIMVAAVVGICKITALRIRVLELVLVLVLAPRPRPRGAPWTARHLLGEHKPGRIKPGRIKRAALSLQNQNCYIFSFFYTTPFICLWTWLWTNGVNANGAAAKEMNFDVRPGTFGKIKVG